MERDLKHVSEPALRVRFELVVVVFMIVPIRGKMEDFHRVLEAWLPKGEPGDMKRLMKGIVGLGSLFDFPMVGFALTNVALATGRGFPTDFPVVGSFGDNDFLLL